MAPRRRATSPRASRDAPAPARQDERVDDWNADDRIHVTVFVRRRRGGRQYDTFALGSQPPALRSQLTRDEFAARHGAAPNDVEAVQRFAATHGLTAEAHPERRTIVLDGSAGAFGGAFGVGLGRYTSNGRHYRGRDGPVVLPEELRRIVKGVFGLSNRPLWQPRNADVTPAETTILTVPKAVELYRFPKNLTGSGQCIGILSLGGGYRRSDLEAHFDKLGLDMPVVEDFSADGAENKPSKHMETTLDITVAGAAAPGARMVVYFAEPNDQGFLSALSSAVHDGVNNPSVISISIGQPERRGRQTYVEDAVEDYLVDAALLGITVVAASGDFGASGLAPQDPPDGRAHAYFPASSTHVLAVGGTVITTSDKGGMSETVWNQPGSSGWGATGGGVSEVYWQPHWQRGADVPVSVNKQLLHRRGKPGVWHGLPDVAAHAAGFEIHFDGQPTYDAGTSAATPLWAALFARINEGLGRSVGYLNPYLYENADGALRGAFNDVTTGDNDTPGAPGYEARRGWDAVTGFGSPNGEALLKALKVQREN
jgi:kumamolisin